MFDKRGTGMSNRTERLPEVDRRMLDVEAAFFAVSEGGPIAIPFAAAHPERTRGLVLWGTFDDRGQHELKGVPGSWQLFAVRF